MQRTGGRGSSRRRRRDDNCDGGEWDNPLNTASEEDGGWNKVREASKEADGGARSVVPENAAEREDAGSAWDASEEAPAAVVVVVGGGGGRDLSRASLLLVDVEGEEQALPVEEVEVPDSAVGHIIGKSHRTINALHKVEGIARVSLVRSERKDHQRVRVHGSAEAVEKVVAQVKRLVIRAAAAPFYPEMHAACLPLAGSESRLEDAVALKLVTPDEARQYLPRHLRAFVVRHSPEKNDKMYYSFRHRLSPDSVKPQHEIITKKRRRSYGVAEQSTYVFGTWKQSFYQEPVVDCLSKFLDSPAAAEKDLQIKLRLQLGRMFYFSTDLNAVGPDWNVTIAQMESMIVGQTLRPLFSAFCPDEKVVKMEQCLLASGYREEVSTSQDLIAVELIKMNSAGKQTFNMKVLQRDGMVHRI